MVVAVIRQSWRMEFDCRVRQHLPRLEGFYSAPAGAMLSAAASKRVGIGTAFSTQ
jgi:hypothetical protein